MLFDIQRTSLHDGPGIRTAVFLKGCPLRCIWCHNPESQSRKREISFRPEACATCGECEGLVGLAKLRSLQDLESLPECLYGARKTTGREMSVEAVMDEVCKDRRFYEKSGGGLTISGGEPMLQPEFTLKLLQAAKAEGIHTCLETCGWASERAYRQALPFVDLFLFDYKATDPETHRRLTGVDNALILANLDLLYQNGASILLRCPLIPGVNDDPEHLAGIAALDKKYPGLQGIDLLPYHNTGNSKYEQYGLVNPLPVLETASEVIKRQWVSTLHSFGCGKARFP